LQCHLLSTSISAEGPAVTIMSYGNIIVTVRCKIQLVEVIGLLFPLR